MRVQTELKLMEGAVVAPLDPDISIPPPTRVPGEASNGRLLIPDRMTRSRTTFDSSRQAADDGYRERTSMNQTFYPNPPERKTMLSYEANYHGAFGGPVQFDGRSKTRVGPANREKNARFEELRKADGDASSAQKMVSANNFYKLYTTRPRTVPPTLSGTYDRLGLPLGVDFGTVVPRHKPGHDVRLLETTAMASWK